MLACIGVVALAGLIYIRLTIVPFRRFDVGSFTITKGFDRIEANQLTERFINRAKWDFFISPIAGRRDKLRFWQAYRQGDEEHLLFRPATSSGTAIVYAFTLHDEKPIWKTEVPVD